MTAVDEQRVALERIRAAAQEEDFDAFEDPGEWGESAPEIYEFEPSEDDLAELEDEELPSDDELFELEPEIVDYPEDWVSLDVVEPEDDDEEEE